MQGNISQHQQPYVMLNTMNIIKMSRAWWEQSSEVPLTLTTSLYLGDMGQWGEGGGGKASKMPPMFSNQEKQSGETTQIRVVS